MSLDTTLQRTQEYSQYSSAYEIVKHMHAVTEAANRITSMLTEQIALVTISLHFEAEGKPSSHRQGQQVIRTDHRQMERSARYLLDNLCLLVRKTDVVFLHIQNIHTFHFIILNGTLAIGQIVQDRLWDALLWRAHNPYDAEMLRPHLMTIGHSAYPSPSSSIEQCITEASVTRASIDLQPERSGRRASAQQKKSDKENDLVALARQLGIPYLPLLPHRSPQQVEQLIHPRLIQELRCYPLGRERGVLTVAVSDPQDRATLERLRRETGLHIFPVLAPSCELQTALERLI